MTQSTTNSICPFCGVGCGIGLVCDNNEVKDVKPLLNHPISKGQLCAKGWNSAFGINRSTRLTHPLIRKNGEFVKCEWSEALSLIAGKLNHFIAHNGSSSVGVISSARATNEDNYAAQKFARAVIKTNNIDHCARICHSPSVAGLKRTLGSGAMTNSIKDVEDAEVILVIGADPTENHAIIGGRIMQAQRNGATLIVVDPRQTRLAKLADIHLQLNLGTNITLLNGLINLIFQHGWQDNEFIEKRCDGLEGLKELVAEFPIDKVAEVTGVPERKLMKVAKLYSQAEKAFLAYGMGITQFVGGTQNVIAVSNLALVCGQIGRKGTGINPLRGQNNVQGACDMGCLPNVYPGYQAADDAEVRNKFSTVWGTTVPEEAGLTSLGMSREARKGNHKAMLIFGEDTMVTDPDQNLVRQGLEALDLLVVVELFMTETARLADVVLPAASFAEKDGTFTNCERRVQLVNKAVNPPGEAKSDWQILCELADKMGFQDILNWRSSEEVFDEMASLTKAFADMTYQRLRDNNGLQWPCNADHPNGTPILHVEEFPIGRGQLIPVAPVSLAENTDDEYPYWLTTNRLHFHYGCGSMTRQSPLLERETPRGILFVNPLDAHEIGLQNHQLVSVSSRRGELKTQVILSEQVMPGLVSMPYHFKETPSNILTNNAMDPVTEMPELKACAVKIEAFSDRNAGRSTVESDA